MTRRYVFADEAGCFSFTKNRGASKYFILCTVTSDSHDYANPLIELRRQLAWERQIDTTLHASEDRQEVRDKVYEFIRQVPIRIDATILEKSKTDPKLHPTQERFYQYAWYYHFKYVAHKICNANDELFITVASLGTKKKKNIFKSILKDVAMQSLPFGVHYRCAFWPADSDPCLQIADYCAWAIQKKWESDDRRSFDLIANKVKTEFDLFAAGKKHYY